MPRIPYSLRAHAKLYQVTGAAIALGALLCATPLQARVTRIVIDEVKALPQGSDTIAYEQVSGRAFGELDPADARNAIIQDIRLGLEKDGRARYVATFVITKPVNLAQASGMMWHDVPNRGRPKTIDPLERRFGDVGLSSAWQGDNAGATANGTRMGVGTNHWLQLPVAQNADGTPVTGLVFGRIVNRAGPGSQALIVQTNPVPYKPASLDTRQAMLVSRTGESMEGVVSGESVIPATDWAWARCGTDTPFPGVPDPAQICLKGGFDPNKLYQVVYTARDPYVLGMGFAAWRDVGAFFKHARADDSGTPNPLAARITHSIARGVSQSGNYLRGWLHLGFNQAEDGRQVHDGLWPIIAGRRIALNFRWAQPDGVLELYQAGGEGPQWWGPYPDPRRGLPTAGILDRCTATRTCPKIIEHFGAAEIWALKLGPEWVGTDAKEDIPLPANVRRYYIASTNHGGGAGGFDTSLPGVGLPKTGANCPGNNYGTGLLPANPLPHAETANALLVHFRNWVMRGTAPPPSRYPLMKPLKADGSPAPSELAEPHKAAMGFPTIPGLRATAPEPGFINPMLDYDWGPQFNPVDGSGVPTKVPPPIKQVIKMLVPRVNADGNEVGGVPLVLLDAPLGTYLGWNIAADGFHKGQLCNYVGGMVPFAKTAQERQASGDPRPSLQERYRDHAGYVEAVGKAIANAQAQSFLLPEDAQRLLRAAEASAVLK